MIIINEQTNIKDLVVKTCELMNLDSEKVSTGTKNVPFYVESTGQTVVTRKEFFKPIMELLKEPKTIKEVYTHYSNDDIKIVSKSKTNIFMNKLTKLVLSETSEFLVDEVSDHNGLGTKRVLAIARHFNKVSKQIIRVNNSTAITGTLFPMLTGSSFRTVENTIIEFIVSNIKLVKVFKERTIYDEENHQMYIKNGLSIYTIDGVKKDNGFNGMYIFDDDENTFNYTKERDIPESIGLIGKIPGQENSNLFNYSVGNANLIDDDVLSAVQQRVLMACHLLTIPFGSYITNKPVAISYGETATGKSTTILTLLRLVKGLKSNLLEMPRSNANEKDITILFNTDILALDNCDSKSPIFNSKLKTGSSGIGSRFRKLNTDSEEVVHKNNPFVLISTKTPKLMSDDDLINRSIRFAHGKIKDNTNKSFEALSSELLTKYYDVLQSELVDYLGLIVEEIKTNGLVKYDGALRSNKWASLILTIIKVLKIDIDGEELMKSMLEEQESFFSSNDVFLNSIIEFKNKLDLNYIAENLDEDTIMNINEGGITTGEFTILYNKVTNSRYKSMSFSQMLNSRKDVLNGIGIEFLGKVVNEKSKGNQWLLKFIHELNTD